MITGGDDIELDTRVDEELERWEKYQETGEVVSNKAMMEWLSSWGSDKEKYCPVK